MNWIYLGIYLSIISTILLIYLDYSDGISFNIVDLIFVSILTLVPFLTFSVLFVYFLKTLSDKYEIKLDTIVIKGKKK